jgi:hypothetical protein
MVNGHKVKDIHLTKILLAESCLLLGINET